MVSGRHDGAGGAKVEATCAAGDLRARMRAQMLAETDVARFVEGTDEVTRLQCDTQYRRRVAGIGTQVAIAQIEAGEQGGAAGKIDNDVAARHRAVARGSEDQGPTRGRRGLREIIDGDFEGAEIAFGGADLASCDRKFADARGNERSGRCDQYRDIEMRLQ